MSLTHQSENSYQVFVKSNDMATQYYANGKILVSGEYLVLHGARALVLPLKFGMAMKVKPIEGTISNRIKWQADALNQTWFKAEIDISDWTILSTTDYEIAKRLVVLLRNVEGMNHTLFQNCSFEFSTSTDFKMEWGLGSSSALIANLSRWASVDPFELLFRTTGGSGADIAAAISRGPVVYSLIDEKPNLCRVSFKPSFFKNLWLVYLGIKQNTSESVGEFRATSQVTHEQIRLIDEITLKMTESHSMGDFMRLMGEHERILSEILQKPTVKTSLFIDFQGEVKSLGAWGGDFILAATENSADFVKNYFQNKGAGPVFSLENIILQ